MMVTKWSTNTTPLIVLAFFIVYFSSDIYDLSLLNLNIMVFFFCCSKWQSNRSSQNKIKNLKPKKRLNEFTLIDIKTCHGAALFPARRRHVPNFLWRRMRHYRADPTFSTNLIIYLSRKIHFLLHHRQQGQGQLWGWKLISSSFGANQVWLKSTLAQIKIGTKQNWHKSNLAQINFDTNQILLKGFKC